MEGEDVCFVELVLRSSTTSCSSIGWAGWTCVASCCSKASQAIVSGFKFQKTSSSFCLSLYGGGGGGSVFTVVSWWMNGSCACSGESELTWWIIGSCACTGESVLTPSAASAPSMLVAEAIVLNSWPRLFFCISNFRAAILALRSAPLILAFSRVTFRQVSHFLGPPLCCHSSLTSG